MTELRLTANRSTWVRGATQVRYGLAPAYTIWYVLIYDSKLIPDHPSRVRSPFRVLTRRVESQWLTSSEGGSVVSESKRHPMLILRLSF